MQMDDNIYKELLAKKLEGNKKWFDKEVIEVEIEGAFQQKCKYYLDHPSHIAFVDEVVSNTNMT